MFDQNGINKICNRTHSLGTHACVGIMLGDERDDLVGLVANTTKQPPPETQLWELPLRCEGAWRTR